MKKILHFVSIVLLIFICCISCQSPEKTPTKITLTQDNVEKYLRINGQYGESKKTGNLMDVIYFYESDFTISIDPVVAGSFNNVYITLKVELTDGWSVTSSDPAYSEDPNNDGYLITTIQLPVSGEEEEVHGLIAMNYHDSHDNRDVQMEIVSVSGIFIPSN